ncbi:MAG: helix-turn-helix domain containing protein [Spirochaetales bacterium]|uniref:Helix-turn-helix domain containing protein n=1 Tax=Candidatus Thalassospirochaeta sargassi TaxID=3119039 RepID=A0AAJ1MNK2_9SPIO|nr:helix-turn-helix domain containing protein [Spirochaetales bacterium]
MKEAAYLHTIKSAERLFNRFGFAKTAMSDIAKAADMSRATIFNNFSSKEGVLKAVLDNKLMEYRKEMKDMTAESTSVSGKIKILLVERIRLFSTMRYISEDEIAVDNSAVTDFSERMDCFFVSEISRLLNKTFGKDEIKRFMNTILFMLKGIEKGITDHISSFSVKQVENDIDFFLKLAVPAEGKEVTDA